MKMEPKQQPTKTYRAKQIDKFLNKWFPIDTNLPTKEELENNIARLKGQAVRAVMSQGKGY